MHTVVPTAAATSSSCFSGGTRVTGVVARGWCSGEGDRTALCAGVRGARPESRSDEFSDRRAASSDLWQDAD